MIKVQVDEAEIKTIVRERVTQILQGMDTDLVFWDSAELQRRTCLSWTTIRATFFFDPQFPRRRLGAKWLFPASETRAFLEKWLDEQPNH